MTLAAGTRLGPYEIVAPLGAGGMGEVYRARDSRLGRDVAIKVLPAHLSDSPEIRARFEREAKAISSLNHPNICTLFDVGREGDHDFLVMELVEGESLVQRIARGPLPAADVLRIGAQIADALDRAHRAGVTHRDLKPGNIMLAKSGAKLMDFGLARRAAEGGPASGLTSAGAGMTQTPTVAAPLTAQGTILGTFQYMAPEQLEGHEADARSDVWALGCVLYEMATGKHAFEGRSQASTIGAIMHSEPTPLSRLAPMAPAALDELVRTCLAKDPDERWQSAGDLRRELQRIAGSQSGTVVAIAAPRRRAMGGGAAGWIVAAALALAVIAVVAGPWRGHPPDSRLVAFAIDPPEGLWLGSPAEAALSADGRMIAFAARDSTAATHLVVRSLANLEERELPGTERCSLPFWSPDGRTIAFFQGGKLRTIGLDGGSPTVLCDAPDARGGAWSQDGVIVFAPSSQGPIMRVPSTGGAPVAVTSIDAGKGQRGHRYPQFLPDGRHFLYVAITPSAEITTYAASIDGGKPVEVCRGGSGAVYAPPGYLLYLETTVTAGTNRLLAKRFDARTLRVAGDARLVVDHVNSNNFGYPNATTDAGGDLVVQHWRDLHRELTWLDSAGRPVGTAIADLDGSAFRLSPDGRRLAYCGNDPLDLYTVDLATGVSTRLTFQNQRIDYVTWSRDGRRIAFSRLLGSTGWEARVKNADGSGADSLVLHAPGLFALTQSWSPDGQWLVVDASDSAGNMDLWRVPMGTRGSPETYQRTPEQERFASISPDGHWIAYVVSDNTGNSLYVQSFPTPGTKYQIPTKDPGSCMWSARGDVLYAIGQDGAPTAIPISLAGGFQAGAPHLLFEPGGASFVRDYAATTGRFLRARPIDLAGWSSLEVVMHWTALLAK